MTRVSMITTMNLLVNKRAVMIKHQDAFSANTTMLRAQGTGNMTSVTEGRKRLQLLLVVYLCIRFESLLVSSSPSRDMRILVVQISRWCLPCFVEEKPGHPHEHNVQHYQTWFIPQESLVSLENRNKYSKQDEKMNSKISHQVIEWRLCRRIHFVGSIHAHPLFPWLWWHKVM